ncbi:MAG: hypothetical protein DWP98_11935 [Bacteroidetes bacterium]|nr:MAG: hypothetical protein DWP98_11935 [Bacteroidota bacterium]MBL1144240.1 hypothetical protein [Bacteroidota bacterium]NOG57036.1 hypothetical protein [Bacteroidota bacterium]
MKILLDIDGVMIPARPWQSYQIGADGFGMFSELSINCLNEIINSSDKPEIVLTTSHKHSFTIKQWSNIFQNRKITKTKINKLNTNNLNTSRIDEIRSWYLKNQNENFIIIDDDKSLNALDTSFKNDHLILTKPTIGLNKTATEEAISKIKHLLAVNEY